MSEQWKPAVGYEGIYSVSSMGRVRSEDRTVIEKTGMQKRLKGRVLRLQPNRGGYLCFNFCAHGKRVAARVHCVVARAFLGPRPSDRHEVAHRDGDRANNRPDNLRWDTRAGNFADKVAHGTHNRGERHPNCRLSSASVHEIRTSSMSSAQVARTYGISHEYAQRVRANIKRRTG